MPILLSDERPEDERSTIPMSAWKASLERLAKAQALLWSRTPILTRRAILREVEQQETR